MINKEVCGWLSINTTHPCMHVLVTQHVLAFEKLTSSIGKSHKTERYKTLNMSGNGASAGASMGLISSHTRSASTGHRKKRMTFASLSTSEDNTDQEQVITSSYQYKGNTPRPSTPPLHPYDDPLLTTDQSEGSTTSGRGSSVTSKLQSYALS